MRKEVGDVICKHVSCSMYVHAQVLAETFNFIWYKYTFGKEVYKSANLILISKSENSILTFFIFIISCFLMFEFIFFIKFFTQLSLFFRRRGC